MEKKNYLHQYKDPRWQKKRLEILQRDDFRCCHCGNKEKTLNVHHKMYEKGSYIWDYPDNLLVTLCEDCHIGAHNTIDEIYNNFRDLIKEWYLCGFDNFEVYNIISVMHDAAIGFRMDDYKENMNIFGGVEGVCNYMQNNKDIQL